MEKEKLHDQIKEMESKITSLTTSLEIAQKQLEENVSE